nr:hypothetical protein [uncultured Chryseobacterium sp.]
MLSPPDIDQLLGFARAQPTSDPANVNNAFMGMVTPNRMHYVILFNGNYQDALTNFSQDDLDKYVKKYGEIEDELSLNLLYTNYLGGPLNSSGVEKLFFKTIKYMGLEGKIDLQRIQSTGTIIKINLDNNNNPIPVPCL